MTTNHNTTTPPPGTSVATAVNGAALLDDVRQSIAKFCVLPSPAALDAATLWVAASHGVPYWNTAPRLVIRAPEKRCGKSRLLDLVEALCHDPLITTNASPSAVYRSIGVSGDDPPTLLIDEADAIFGPKAGDNEDLRGLLNAGHQRGRPTLRYDAGTKKVEKIETFAMAALAGIGVMPDTIEDRAVIIKMRRRAPHENAAPYRIRRDRDALNGLRAELHQWVRAHETVLTNATPELPVEDRAADTWEPLVAIADLAGGHWPLTARAAIGDLTDTNNTDGSSYRVRLLADIRTILGDEETGLPSRALVERLCEDPEAPWATFGGTGLTVRKLGLILREFEIGSKNRRWADGNQAKGYVREDFTDAWERYCDLSVTSVTSVTSVPDREKCTSSDHSVVTQDLVVTHTSVTTPQNTGICDACHEPMSYDSGTGKHPGCI